MEFSKALNTEIRFHDLNSKGCMAKKEAHEDRYKEDLAAVREEIR